MPLIPQVVLADFGESRAFGNASPGSAVTTRNRGTECVKSPEMLLVANARKTSRTTYDRRKREGAGAHCSLEPFQDVRGTLLNTPIAVGYSHEGTCSATSEAAGRLQHAA